MQIAVLNNKTMSSLEISKLTGKRPGDVNRDIKVMCDQLGYADLRSEQNQGVTVILNEQNQTKEILLDHDHTLTLISGYEVKLRMAIIKRWKELEEQKPKSQIEIIIESALALQRIEQQQSIQSEQILTVQSDIARLTGTSSYMAILAWTRKNEIEIPTSKASSMGKQAANHCRLKGIEIGEVCDERFFKINTYPEKVLDLLFKAEE